MVHGSVPGVVWGQPVNAVTWPLFLPVLGAVLFVAAGVTERVMDRRERTKR